MSKDNANNGDKKINTTYKFSDELIKKQREEPIILKGWFQELDPWVQNKLQYGPPDPFFNMQYIYNLSPHEIMEAITDHQLRGLCVYGNLHDEKEVEDQVRNLLRHAAWLRETSHFTTFEEDFLYYRFVRHYGGTPVIIHWKDHQMLHQKISDFKISYMDKFVIGHNSKTGKIERILFTEAFLKSPQVRRYNYVEFLPGLDERETPENVLNLWRGWPQRDDCPDDNDYEPEDCRLFLDHMLYNVCGGDHNVYIYLMGWMADAVINPHRTSEVAIVMHGPQGSGKTLWANCFMSFFGKAHVLTLDKPDQVTGTHNKHLQDKCVVFADEAFFAGNRQHGATLKTLVTNDEIFIHPKFVDGFMAKKLFRVIIASNDEHVIRAEVDDRRYLVLNVDAGENNQNGEYFGTIMNEWRDGGRQALFNWLRGAYWRRQLESGMWDMRLRPKTQALSKQKDLSLPEVQAIVHQMLHDGELPDYFAVDEEKGLVFVATRLLAQRNSLKPSEETALGQNLRVVAGENAKSVRVYLGDGNLRKQFRGYWVPALDICRKSWEEHLGRTIDWPTDVTTWDVSVLDGGPEVIPF